MYGGWVRWGLYTVSSCASRGERFPAKVVTAGVMCAPAVERGSPGAFRNTQLALSAPATPETDPLRAASFRT